MLVKLMMNSLACTSTVVTGLRRWRGLEPPKESTTDCTDRTDYAKNNSAVFRYATLMSAFVFLAIRAVRAIRGSLFWALLAVVRDGGGQEFTPGIFRRAEAV